MKRMPAKPLNEGSYYIGSQRDKKWHCLVTCDDDPRKEHSMSATWIRGEEYPMPYKIRMPEEDDVLCPELLEEFPNDAARRRLAEMGNV